MLVHKYGPSGMNLAISWNAAVTDLPPGSLPLAADTPIGSPDKVRVKLGRLPAHLTSRTAVHVLLDLVGAAHAWSSDMVRSDAGAGFGMPPELINACTSIGVGSDREMATVVPVECFETGGMIHKVVERERAGEMFSGKMAVVIFCRQQEPLFPHNVARKVTKICGKCIDRQHSAGSNAPGLVVDLTEVAICMTNLVSVPGALGNGHQGGTPRAVGVLPRSFSQRSFDSPCCNIESMDLLWDSSAQAFGSGHIIANMRYRFARVWDKDDQFQLFIFMLP